MSRWNEWLGAQRGVLQLNCQHILTVDNFLHVLFGDNTSISMKENDEKIMPTAEVTSKGRTCLLCGLTFTKLCDQLVHFKSDSHVLTLRQHMRGKIGVNDIDEDEGDGDDDDEEDAADIEEEEAAEDVVHSREYESEENNKSSIEGIAYRSYNKHDGILVIFQPTDSIWSFSCNNALLDSSYDGCNNYWDHLRYTINQLRVLPPYWLIIILRNGKFAGAIYDSKTSSVILHKVVKRYTIRAKSGGSQSSHDNQGKNAKSMGAMLRRYGEKSLKDDVRNILLEWAPYIETCGKVILSVSKTMRHVIFPDDHPSFPLKRDDTRIVNVPFMVSNVTFEETKSIFAKISTVSFMRISESDNQQDATRPTERVVVPQSRSKETATVFEQQTQEETNRCLEAMLPSNMMSRSIISACKSNDYGGLRQVLTGSAGIVEENGGESDEDSADENDDVNESNTAHLEKIYAINLPESIELLSTPLHLSSELGHYRIVTLLLMHGADPTKIDVRNRLPYYLAKDNNTKEAFKRFRSRHEGKYRHYEWDRSSVPFVSIEAEQNKKLKEKAKKARAKQRKKEQKAEEHEKERLKKEAEEEEKRKQETAMALNNTTCSVCTVPIKKSTATSLFDGYLCSSQCVAVFRRNKQREAAEKRLK